MKCEMISGGENIQYFKFSQPQLNVNEKNKICIKKICCKMFKIGCFRKESAMIFILLNINRNIFFL